MEYLPKDIIGEIQKFLDFEDIAAFRQTCKAINFMTPIASHEELDWVKNDFCPWAFCNNLHPKYYAQKRFTLGFIERYRNEFDWYYMSQHCILSEEIIDRYANRVNWMWISANQTLSEEFIEKYADKVYWDSISMQQALSEQFIKKHSKRIHFNLIAKNKHISVRVI